MFHRSSDSIVCLSGGGKACALDHTAGVQRYWLLYSVIRILVVSLLACGPARAQVPATSLSNIRALAVAQVVLGIISYTAWPIPPSPVRLCIIGEPHEVEGRLLNGSRVGITHLIAEPISINDPRLGAECDVVYAGALTDAELNVLRDRIQGHPILTISVDDAACSGIVMFCLTTNRTKIAFSVNLDSVARSGVEVNPQVLLLGRRQAAPP